MFSIYITYVVLTLPLYILIDHKQIKDKEQAIASPPISIQTSFPLLFRRIARRRTQGINKQSITESQKLQLRQSATLARIRKGRTRNIIYSQITKPLFKGFKLPQINQDRTTRLKLLKPPKLLLAEEEQLALFRYLGTLI